MKTKHPNRSDQLKLIDLSIDLISLCFSVPGHSTSYVKSVIRIPEVFELCNALCSGGEVSSDIVDDAVTCVEKANEVQIESYYKKAGNIGGERSAKLNAFMYSVIESYRMLNRNLEGNLESLLECLRSARDVYYLICRLST